MARAFLLSLLILLPHPAFATLLISEVMYDLSGTDTGREWIEITNTGTSEIDLSTYKFFEANTNHALIPYQGSAVLGAGSAVVIVQKADLFLADYPAYSGAILDSSWSSLSNEGETLAIHDGEGNVVDQISYTKEQGATGDGLSLERSGSVFVARNPTPGVFTTSSPPPPPPPTNSGGQTQRYSSSQQSTSTSKTTAGKKEEAVAVSAGGNRALVTNIDHLFEASVTGLPSTVMPFVQYRWNFGNGEEVLGKTVLYRYSRPGEYAVVLSASVGGQSAVDRIVVTVTSPEVSISQVSSEGLLLENKARKDLDLSGWNIRSLGTVFTIPKDTYLLAGKSFYLESRVTKLLTIETSAVDLTFPNGIHAARYDPASLSPSSEKKSPRTQLEKPTTKNKPIPEVRVVSNQVPTSNMLFPTSSVVAAVAASTEEESPIMLPLLGLVALLGIASGAVILMRQSKALPNEGMAPDQKGGKNVASEADLYTIVE